MGSERSLSGLLRPIVTTSLEWTESTGGGGRGQTFGVDPATQATLAAVQGGLLLTQVHRRTEPLESALDEMVDHIAGLQPRRRTTPTT